MSNRFPRLLLMITPLHKEFQVPIFHLMGRYGLHFPLRKSNINIRNGLLEMEKLKGLVVVGVFFVYFELAPVCIYGMPLSGLYDIGVGRFSPQNLTRANPICFQFVSRLPAWP